MVKKQLFVVPYDGQVASVVEYVEDPETKQTAVGQWDSDALGWASIVAADDCWRSLSNAVGDDDTEPFSEVVRLDCKPAMEPLASFAHRLWW